MLQLTVVVLSVYFPLTCCEPLITMSVLALFTRSSSSLTLSFTDLDREVAVIEVLWGSYAMAVLYMSLTEFCLWVLGFSEG